MYNPCKIVVTALALLLAFNPNVEAIDTDAWENAIATSLVPVQALREALMVRERLTKTSHLFKFYELRPIANLPGALGFVDQVDQGIFPTISDKNILVIFDLDRHSSSNRLHIVNFVTKSIESLQAAHGIESDCGGIQV